MFVTGPDVVKTVTHEEIDFEGLGGAGVHSELSGVCHIAADSEVEVLRLIRELMSYIPQNNMEDPPYVHSSDDLMRMENDLNIIVPKDPAKPYDIKKLMPKTSSHALLAWAATASALSRTSRWF
jgi:acetyl-CoA carboxylase carboxyltransferase component